MLQQQTRGNNDEIQQNRIVITSYEISQSHSKHNQLDKNADAVSMPQTPSQNARGTKITGIKIMLLIFPCLWFLFELYLSL